MPLSEQLLGYGEIALWHLAAPFLPVVQQTNNFFFLYLLTTLIAALVVRAYLRNKGGPQRDIFGKDIWWSASAKADYRFHLVNYITYPLIFGPLLIGGAAAADKIAAALSWVAGGGFLSGPDWLLRGIYTLLFFVAYDFGRFLAHWGMHVVPLLWQFHKVHHSAETLTPLTTSRAHPVDHLLMHSGGALGGALVTGPFLWAAQDGTIDAFSFLGANALIAAFSSIALLRHTHVWLSYGRWEKIFISPAMHQIHHSALRHHWDANCGFCFAWWDRLVGKWVPAKGNEAFPMGLAMAPTASGTASGACIGGRSATPRG